MAVPSGTPGGAGGKFPPVKHKRKSKRHGKRKQMGHPSGTPGGPAGKSFPPAHAPAHAGKRRAKRRKKRSQAMPKPPASNGSADIQAQGQTKIPEFGMDPDFKGLYSGQKKPTDLKLKQMAQAQQKGANSILEGLSSVMAQLASLSVLPDAQPHVPFVNSVMAEIQKYLHKPQVGGMALGPAGQGGPPPGAGGPPDAGAGPVPGGMPPGAQPATPPVDELRRMLAANSNQ